MTSEYSPMKYRPRHAVIQKLASSAPGSWVLAHSLHYLDPLVLKVSGGRATLSGFLAGIPVMMVTTTGARSGLPRTQPLLPVRDPADAGRFALIASNWGQHHFPAWYFNLKKHPRARCTFEGHTGTYVAHEATGEEYERFWRLATATYLGYSMYKQRAGRRIPVLVMDKDTE